MYPYYQVAQPTVARRVAPRRDERAAKPDEKGLTRIAKEGVEAATTIVVRVAVRVGVEVKAGTDEKVGVVPVEEAAVVAAAKANVPRVVRVARAPSVGLGQEVVESLATVAITSIVNKKTTTPASCPEREDPVGEDLHVATSCRLLPPISIRQRHHDHPSNNTHETRWGLACLPRHDLWSVPSLPKRISLEPVPDPDRLLAESCDPNLLVCRQTLRPRFNHHQSNWHAPASIPQTLPTALLSVWPVSCKKLEEKIPARNHQEGAVSSVCPFPRVN